MWVNLAKQRSQQCLSAHCIASFPDALNRLGCTSKIFALFLIVLFHSQAPILNPALLSGPAAPFLSMSVADVPGISSGSPDTAASNCSTERLEWGAESWSAPVMPWITLDRGEFEGSLLAWGVQNRASYNYGYITRLSSHVAECKTILHVSKCWENSNSFPFNC